jgi:hypothetical protein
MARLPQPGGDAGTWGTLLNEFLAVEHDNDGTLKAAGSLAGKQDTSAKGVANGYASLDSGAKIPLAQLATGTGTASTYLRGDRAWSAISKTDVGLANVDNTSDASKPVSTATQAALDAHVAATDPHSTASYAIMRGGGRRVFVQSTDPNLVPANGVTDGDLWIDTS